MEEGIKFFLDNIVTLEPYYFDRLIKKAPKNKSLGVSLGLFHINSSKLLFQEEKQMILPDHLIEEFSGKEIPNNIISSYIQQFRGNMRDEEIYKMLNEATNRFFTNEKLIRGYDILKHKHFCSKFYDFIVKDLRSRLN